MSGVMMGVRIPFWRKRQRPRIATFVAVSVGTVSVLFLTALAGAAEQRTWTAGKVTKEATFVSLDGQAVTLRLENGDEVEVPLAKLSAADKAYVAALTMPPAADDPFQPKPKGGGAAGAAAAGPQPLVSLTVTGVGVSKDDAEKDAYRNAIRRVVGAFVDAETIVANDEVIRDQVITLSSAYVEQAATRSVVQENGLFTVTVDARVRVTKVLDALKQHNVTFVSIDPSAAQAAIAKALTLDDQAKGREELLARALRTYPEGCIRVSIEGEPAFTKTAIQFRIKVEPDMEAFAAVADKVCEALAAEGRKSGVLRNVADVFVVGDKATSGEYFSAHLVGAIARKFANPHHLGLQERHDCHNDEDIGRRFAEKLQGSRLTIGPMYSMAMETVEGPRNLERIWDRSLFQEQVSSSYLVLPIRANKSLQRIHWRWFEFTGEEEGKVLNALLTEHAYRSAVGVSLQEQGGVGIADDAIELDTGCAREFAYADRSIWILAPFTSRGWCGGWNPWVYTPSFAFQHTITLSPEELKQVRVVKCSVQRGEPLFQPER
jgi:hypothetical protein